MVTCPFECAEAMRSVVDQHMTAINGVGGEKLQCKDTFADISETQYGGRNDEVSSGVETDDFEMEPLDDPSVQRAAASMLANINGYRHKNCPHMPLFPAPAHVLYAKAGLGDQGLRQYRLEVQLGGGHVYEGRMAHLPLDEEFESLDESSPSAYESYQVMRCRTSLHAVEISFLFLFGFSWPWIATCASAHRCPVVFLMIELAQLQLYGSRLELACIDTFLAGIHRP